MLAFLLGFSYTIVMKTPQQHNLPIDEDYFFVDAYEADEIATVCANCNRPIRNIATIRNTQSKMYSVGMDCLETLLNECGSFLREQVQIKQAKKEFAMLKSIKKLAKNGKLVVALETLQNPYRESWFAFDIDNPVSFKYTFIRPESDLMTQIIEIFMQQNMITINRFDARSIAWAMQFGEDSYYEWDTATKKRIRVKI